MRTEGPDLGRVGRSEPPRTVGNESPAGSFRPSADEALALVESARPRLRNSDPRLEGQCPDSLWVALSLVRVRPLHVRPGA